MAKINILTKDVYNKIAAGEVVEKPASVVKELVENSIDAGATNITIEILNGGIEKIKISDNGCGIEYDDFDKVFLAHATSKIKDIDDLSSIGTLGFRGEALSSIASVSNITLASKTDQSSEGYQVKVNGGEMGEVTPIGSTTGTYILVEDLFFNIPARKKFLRKPKLEESDITNYIARLILANPNISFKYTADNKIIYQSFGTGLYDAIYSIYGKSIVDNIFEVEFSRGDFKFTGYLGKPTFSKPNRTYQTLVINGRYVINQTISTSIYKAYENFLMKGNFPFFVLHLNIPLDKIDVNVHPNKLEVKFEDSNSIFGIVYSEVSELLYSVNNTKKIVSEEIINIDKSKLVNLNSNIGSQYSFTQHNDSLEIKNDVETENNDDEIKEVTLTSSVEYEVNKEDQELQEFKKNISEVINNEKILPYQQNNSLDFKVAQNKDFIFEEFNDTYQKDVSLIKENQVDSNTHDCCESTQKSFLDNSNNFRIIGTLINTYILIEKENKLLIIDQHAGHERLLYDKFNKELDNREVAIQPLMIPHVIETNYNEAIFINENIDVIKELGFDIEEFGDNSFKISTCPLLFENVNLNDFFDSILSDIDNKLILSKQNTIKEYLAKKACKSAVKANMKLSENEISLLIDRLNTPDQILLCPHGRPIIVEVTQKDIEKWFKRIV